MSERVVCVVQARMGSTRLPGKVLEDLGGQPMLRFLLARLRPLRCDRLVVATTDHTIDDPIVELAASEGVDVVRGPEDDVLRRFMLVLREHPADHLIRITADCPLVDPEVANDVAALHLARAADYTCNVLPRTFPRGLDVEVARAYALAEADAEARDSAEREHVTPFLYRRPARFRLANLRSPLDLGDERWTVDSPDDLARVRDIVGRLPRADAGFREILAVAGRHPPSGDGVRLRLAQPDDADRFLEWRNDPEAARFSPTGPVDPEQHAGWFGAKLDDPGSRLLVGVERGSDLGYVRLDVDDGAAEVSIAVAPAHRGRGVATAMLRALQSLLAGDQQVRKLVARVQRENEPSRSAFERTGFVVVHENDRDTLLEWRP